ncbi:MAG: MFS transporter [Eggerthellaceae bacterium]
MAFAVFALSFIFRPLGAAFWGSMGDKKGRKWSLSTSILLMTAAAFLIGCLPSFETIGLLSPILLLALRSIQGFFAAGEYSGAAVFLAEYAPPKHRGKYAPSFLRRRPWACSPDDGGFVDRGVHSRGGCG